MDCLHYYLCKICKAPFESWGSMNDDDRICLNCRNPKRRNFAYWENNDEQNLLELHEVEQKKPQCRNMHD